MATISAMISSASWTRLPPLVAQREGERRGEVRTELSNDPAFS